MSSLVELRKLIPESLHLLGLLAEPIDEPYVERFTQTYGTDWLELLVDDSRAPVIFANVWQRIMERPSWEPLELLLAEHWISARPSVVAASLPDHMNFEKTLHTVRTCFASYLYSRAKSVNWREPLTYMRALRVAEIYLSGVVENIDYANPDSRKASFGKLGAARVLQAQYGEVDLQRIQRAIENLSQSIELGNDKPEAFRYLASARIRHFDLSGDRAQLVELVRGRGHAEVDDVQLAVAEAWIRLAELADTKTARMQFLARAAQAADLVLARHPGIVDRSHAALIRAIASFNAASSAQMPVKGLRLPFSLRQRVATWGEADREGARSLLESTIGELGAISGAFPTEPILRRLLAQMRSLMADLLPLDARADLRAEWHKAAVETRGSLTDPESSLENVLDLFALHAVKQQDWSLVQACTAALKTAFSDPTWATPVLLLARELSAEPGGWSSAAVYQLSRAVNPTEDPPLLQAVVDRDIPALYAIAARRALASREIARRGLGGRVGVFLAEDYSGVLNDQFVFKPTLVALADHEERRSSLVATQISRFGRAERFRLAQTLARSPLPSGDPLREANCEIVVAKSFHAGQILSDAIRTGGGAARAVWLGRAAEYLALIHSIRGTELEGDRNSRQELRRKEFGRWLKALRVPDHANVFERWWVAMTDLPLLLRRDAHADNWIVTDDGALVALDLEAHGRRPLGYELSQLMEDVPVIPVDDTGHAERDALVRAYVDHLGAFGVHVAKDAAWEGFQLGCIARAVRHLTDPDANALNRAHGRGLLAWLRDRGATDAIAQLAAELLSAWDARSAATVGSGHQVAAIGDARRRHLSRAMAYQLRHGGTEDVPADKHGWMTFDDLVDLLNGQGHRTNEAELATVAEAIDERRYEISEQRIRALYGHTRPVELEYERVEDGRTLYHGTAFDRLNSILAAGVGLIPGRRQWVHLTSDPLSAAVTARRHGAAVLLAIDTNLVSDVFAAGGGVYLAKNVPVEAISVVQPLSLFTKNIDVAVV